MSSAAVPTEYQEQVTVIQWCAVQWVRIPLAPGEAKRARVPLSEVIYAVPNGEVMRRSGAGYSDRAQMLRMLKLKKQGFRPGVPDLVLPIPRGGYAGLYLELKRRDGGRLAASQAGFVELLSRCQYRVRVAAGAEAAIAELRAYLELAESPLWSGALPAGIR